MGSSVELLEKVYSHFVVSDNPNLFSGLAKRERQKEQADAEKRIRMLEGNVEALVTTISSLLNDLVRCEEMGRAGRRWAEEMFDIRQVVSEHICIYEDLLEKVSS